MLRRLSVAVLAVALAAAGEPRWKVQFFHDELKSRFAIVDIGFADADRGVAVGLVLSDQGKPKPMSVVTRDGGKTWDYLPLKEPPVSLFFLNPTAGWMVTTKGVWFTEEAGRSWRKLSKPADVVRVRFLTPQKGFAIGVEKTFLETSDGGVTWRVPPGLTGPETTKEYTSYNWIEFLNEKTGMVAGRAKRPERRDEPEWMDPEGTMPERPSLTLFLETFDGGSTWKSRTASLFGRVSRIRFGPGGNSLALFEFDSTFKWPSEVLKLDARNGGSTRVLARKDLATTDIALLDGKAYAAGFEPPGRMARLPVPGKLRVFQSEDLTTWSEMRVDYRAVANYVVLAVRDPEHAWLATDTGMILRLAED
jgi:photosystem II stability/assembly factor-like uncharacterized protein